MDISNNLLLYGPPGTGKTYNTVNYSVAIIENRPLEDVISEGYDLALEKYDRYTKMGRIDFMTFHQSLGYDDFIEGIRPVVTEDDSLIYRPSAGTFYDFCIRAEHPTPINALLPEGAEIIPKDATIWIVSPGGFGENRTRNDSLHKGKIAVSSMNGGSAFGNVDEVLKDAKQGDVLISMYSEDMIDGVGVLMEDVSSVRRRPSSTMYASAKWIRLFRDETGSCASATNLKIDRSMMSSLPCRATNMTMNDLAALIAVEDKESSDVGNCVFIIDEINRGNISKIFGELITLLESSRRKGLPECLEAYLPQLKVKFSIPQNVFVLGTMNTADKSLAALDTALRRRFEFVEMMPNPNVLKGRRINDIDLSKLLAVINNRVELLYDREHMLGHAYFISVKTMDDLAQCFIKKVIPLLQEYFFDDYEKMCWVLGKGDDPRQCPFIRMRRRNQFQMTFDLPDVYDIVTDYQVFLNPESYIQIYKGVEI